MAIDKTREYDLEELARAITNARTPGEKEHYRRIMYSILNQSDDIRYWREELLKAARVSDTRRMRYITEKIRITRLNETNGVSWGNQKGERNLTN